MPTSSAEPFHLQVRAARRAAHWSQSELAARAGCRQSQISEFEAGVRGKVSRETVAKFADLLGLAAPVGDGVGDAAAAPAAPGARARCPNFECPSNLPYWLGGELLFLPLGTAGAGTKKGYMRPLVPSFREGMDLAAREGMHPVKPAPSKAAPSGAPPGAGFGAGRVPDRDQRRLLSGV